MIFSYGILNDPWHHSLRKLFDIHLITAFHNQRRETPTPLPLGMAEASS
jgi:hypothetical protein